MFVGRTRELTALRDQLASPKSALIVVTGRRRIGKTRLILEACGTREIICFQASHETARLNFEAFKRVCTEKLADYVDLDSQTEWLGLLSCLAIAARQTPGLIVVLDNFSTLCEVEESLPVTLRMFWQSGLPSDSGLKLILSGANTSRMTELTRGRPTQAEHALAGCDPVLFDLGPLPLQEAAGFFPDYSHDACIAAYAIFGGVPAYLQACHPGRTLRANVIELLLQPEGRLTEEPERMLSADLRDIKVYASILRAIANGYRESSEIRAFAMGPQSSVSISSYLERLRAMRMINDVRSLDADPKARYIRFAISDPLTRFWHLFVQPHRVQIVRGEGEALFDTTIKRQLGDYMVPGFEDICRDFVRTRSETLFEAPAEAVGQMWGPDYDIPIAGRLSDRSLLFGACEWHTRKLGQSGADYLMQQVGRTEFAPELTGNRPSWYVLFSRSGFTSDVEDHARQLGTLKLVTSADIVGLAA